MSIFLLSHHDSLKKCSQFSTGVRLVSWIWHRLLWTGCCRSGIKPLGSLCLGALKHLLVGVPVDLLSLGVSCLPQLWGDREEEEQDCGVEGKGADMKAGEDGVLAHSVLSLPWVSFSAQGQAPINTYLLVYSGSFFLSPDSSSRSLALFWDSRLHQYPLSQCCVSLLLYWNEVWRS